jgi:hypothetical protein|tara:strand:- start:812 stop:1300 length:489 start_codon:yes stop_codon:yes gene_type:complete
MEPSIKEINKTLQKEQKIQILSIDDKKTKLTYDNIIRMNRLQRITPLMYNSNIGTSLVGYRDIKDVKKFLRAEPIKQRIPLKPMPKLNIQTSSRKDFDNWKKDVILWYEKNKNNLPSNIIDRDRMIDMVYNQFMAHRTKPKTIEDRLSALEEKVNTILKKMS